MATPKTNIKQTVLNDLDGGRGSGVPPKRRTRFTYTIPAPTNESLYAASPASASVPQPSRSTSAGLSSTMYTLQNRRRALHDSMEDLHRPKNYRQKSSEPSIYRKADDIEESEKEGSFTEEGSCRSVEDSISENDTEDDLLSMRQTEDDLLSMRQTEDDLLSLRQEQDQNNFMQQQDQGGHQGQARENNLSRGEDLPDEEKVLLLEENLLLKSQIEDEKKEVLKRKVACGFAFEAVRKQKFEISEMEAEIMRKKEEVAARLILHHLLLNSWRLKSGELTAVMNDNAQLHKTIDNLCLQLRVVRHLQTTEKEKSVVRVKEFDHLTEKLGEIREDNRKIRMELEKVAEERNALSSKVESLTREHEKVTAELKALIEKRDVLIRASELNKVRAEKFQRENVQLKKEVTEAKDQVKALTTQSSHWQEKSRAYESECWELKLQVDTKDRSILDLQKGKQGLQKEKEVLALSKSKTEELLKQSRDKLEISILDKDTLESQLKQCQAQLHVMFSHVSQLTSSLSRLKQDNKDLRNNLYDYSLKNVRRRRAWGKALYYIFNPMEIIRTLYSGEEHLSPRYRKGSGGQGQHDGEFHLHILKEDE